MDNAEEILHSLEEFTKVKPKDIPRELEDYLNYVAKTGDPVYHWPLVKHLFREKLMTVITDFYESSPMLDLPPCPNVDPFHYDRMKTSLLERLESFVSAPFTVQRICELLTNPKKEYNRADKFMRAIEKNVLVVSTREPGMFKRCDDSVTDAIVNGIPEHKSDSDIIHVNVCTEPALVVTETTPSSDVLAAHSEIDELDRSFPIPCTTKVWDKICVDNLPCSPESVEDILKSGECGDKVVDPPYIVESSTVDECSSAIDSTPLIVEPPTMRSSDNVTGSEATEEKEEFAVNTSEICDDNVVSTTLETDSKTDDEIITPSEQLFCKEQSLCVNSSTVDANKSSLPDFGVELSQHVSILEHKISDSEISNTTIASSSDIEVTLKVCDVIEKSIIITEVPDSSDVAYVNNDRTSSIGNETIQTEADTSPTIEIKEVADPESSELSPISQDGTVEDNVIFQAMSPENSVTPESSGTIEAEQKNIIIEEINNEYVSENESLSKEEVQSDVVDEDSIIPCEERKEGSVIHLTASVSEEDQPKSEVCCETEEEAMDVDETSNQQMAMLEGGDIDAEPMDQSEQAAS